MSYFKNSSSSFFKSQSLLVSNFQEHCLPYTIGLELCKFDIADLFVTNINFTMFVIINLLIYRK